MPFHHLTKTTPLSQWGFLYPQYLLEEIFASDASSHEATPESLAKLDNRSPESIRSKLFFWLHKEKNFYASSLSPNAIIIDLPLSLKTWAEHEDFFKKSPKFFRGNPQKVWSAVLFMRYRGQEAYALS